MHITFFIGNGFDINLGLKTKYSCFYPYFIEHAKQDNMIKKWIDGNEQLWADLEEKLGQQLENVSEDKLEQFYDDKEEMDRLLIEYLEKEQEKYSFDDKETIMQEFTRSMQEFYHGLPINGINSIKDTLEKYKAEEFIYSYITFNYTDIMDKIVGLYKTEKKIGTHQNGNSTKYNLIGNVIHIHGTTNEEMILGVNDESQIENEHLKSNALFLDTFVKKRMNSSIGQRKTESVVDIVDKSRIICVFGMSLGNTDKMWWEKLITWLGSNDNTKLIIFWKGYEETLNKRIPSAVIRLNEKIKKDLFQKGKGNRNEEYYTKIKDRIFISYNSNIFTLPKVTMD